MKKPSSFWTSLAIGNVILWIIWISSGAPHLLFGLPPIAYTAIVWWVFGCAGQQYFDWCDEQRKR